MNISHTVLSTNGRCLNVFSFLDFQFTHSIVGFNLPNIRQAKIMTCVYRENDECWNRSHDSSSSFYYFFSLHFTYMQ